MRTEILYEDEDVLVIHKPAGLPTQTAKVGQLDAVSELKNYLAKKSGSKGQPYLGIIHRLDQPVEGLLVFAKNKNAAAALTSQLQKKSEGLNKQYQAIVCGKLPAEEGTLVDYLYEGAGKKAEIVSEAEAGEKNAKRAELRYKVIRELSEETTLVDIELMTGRFHQIRAQMAHAGVPLLGDRKYGTAQSDRCTSASGARNVALCADRLSFQHPKTGKKMDFIVKPNFPV